MKKIFYLSSIIFMSLTACQKEEAEQPVTPQPTNSAKAKLLINGSWKISEWAFTRNGLTEDLLLFSVACERDDSFTFKDGGTWKRDENTQKCNFVAGFDPRKFDGTWVLQDNDTKLKISGFDTNSGDTVWTLEELSSNTLKIAYTSTGSNVNGQFTTKSVITFKQ